MTIAATMAQAANAQPGIGLTDEERAATEKHKKELARRSRLNGEEAFATLCIKYYVPKSKSKELSDLVMLRERRKAAYDYIYEKSPARRASAKLAIDSAFQDSIDVRLIPPYLTSTRPSAHTSCKKLSTLPGNCARTRGKMCGTTR